MKPQHVSCDLVLPTSGTSRTLSDAASKITKFDSVRNVDFHEWISERVVEVCQLVAQGGGLRYPEARDGWVLKGVCGQ